MDGFRPPSFPCNAQTPALIGLKMNLSLTYNIFFQVVIVGNGAVGKSSLIQKYCKGIFTSEYKKTIGVDFLEKRI